MTRSALFIITSIVIVGLIACKQEQKVETISYSEVEGMALIPGSIQNFHIGRGHYSNSFVGQIDEVTVWKIALSEQEVRELRHLTKENAIVSEPDLIAYY